MNYKSFNLGDWINHINGVIEDETTLDGKEMRDLVKFLKTKFLKTLNQWSILDKLRVEIENRCGLTKENHCRYCSYCNSVMGVREILEIIDKYKVESEDEYADSN